MVRFLKPNPLSITFIEQLILGSSTMVCPEVLIITIGKLEDVKRNGIGA